MLDTTAGKRLDSSTLHPSGHLLRTIRWQQGLTQTDLGTRAGVHPQYISRIERGVSKGGPKVWKRLADALNVSVIDMFEEVERSA